MVNRMYVAEFTDGTKTRFWCEEQLSSENLQRLLDLHNEYYGKNEIVNFWEEEK